MRIMGFIFLLLVIVMIPIVQSAKTMSEALTLIGVQLLFLFCEGIFFIADMFV